MTMHRIPSILSAAVLLAGFTASTAHAQIGTFSSATVTISMGTGDVLGFGAGSFVGIVNSGATLTLSGTGGAATDIFGTITEPLTGVDATIIAGADTTTITGATGTLTIGPTDQVSFSDTTLGITSTTYPGLKVTELSFLFTASPPPAVIGGTTLSPGIVVGGIMGVTSSGSDGAVAVTFAPVPEPGTVSMLVGLAVTGTGLGLRRLRRRAA
jgi:hypothetical protein